MKKLLTQILMIMPLVACGSKLPGEKIDVSSFLTIVDDSFAQAQDLIANKVGFTLEFEESTKMIMTIVKNDQTTRSGSEAIKKGILKYNPDTNMVLLSMTSLARTTSTVSTINPKILYSDGTTGYVDNNSKGKHCVTLESFMTDLSTTYASIIQSSDLSNLLDRQVDFDANELLNVAESTMETKNNYFVYHLYSEEKETVGNTTIDATLKSMMKIDKKSGINKAEIDLDAQIAIGNTKTVLSSKVLLKFAYGLPAIKFDLSGFSCI